MSKGGSSGAIQQVPIYSASDQETVTPAIAKSIAQDTESAQAQQLQARQRLRGVSSTYLRGTDLASTMAGKSKLGQ